MRRERIIGGGFVVTSLIVAGAMAFAEPAPSESRLVDDGVFNSAKEVHDHHAHQHDGEDGHLPGSSANVVEVGHSDLFADAEQPGRIGDVSAKGNYAFVTLFWEPECQRGGVQVIDISDPANPKKGPMIPSHTDTFTGEGSQVITLNTPRFKGDVLVYQNEICPGATNGVGGVTLVDVTNPMRPKKLVEGFGDFTVAGKSQTHSNQVHSAFAWVNDETGRAYVIMTDDEEATDTDIIEITDPSKPTWVADYDLSQQSAQDPGAVHGDNVFIHDEVVKKIGDRYVALLSYWDGGYIKLDVTDPANATFISDTDFAQHDPVRLLFGQQISPEGNAHEAEFTNDDELFLATDEDFDPYRVVATITDGPNAGTEFTAIQGSDTPPIDADTALTGDTRFVGLACDAGTIPPADASAAIAVIERGVCDFTVKLQNVEAQGYEGAIVFNRTGLDGCETLISMLADANIPSMFVSRTDGFRILGASLDEYTCSEDGTGTAAPASPADSASVDVRAVFDGWGYVHLFDAETMEDLDQYFIPESQDPAFAEGFGDLSVHEVATDPDEDLAYVAYYTGGFRVLEYYDEAGNPDLQEVGHFIHPDGNNFWGVEVHKHPNGQKYVLLSDRDSGVWIFQYQP